MSAVGFYKDRKGRVRPITVRRTPLTEEEALTGEYDLEDIYSEPEKKLSPATLVLKEFLTRRPMANRTDMEIAILMAGHSKDTANEVIQEFQQRRIRRSASNHLAQMIVGLKHSGKTFEEATENLTPEQKRTLKPYWNMA